MAEAVARARVDGSAKTREGFLIEGEEGMKGKRIWRKWVKMWVTGGEGTNSDAEMPRDRAAFLMVEGEGKSFLGAEDN